MKFSYLMYDPVPTLPELSRRMRRVAELGYQGIELSATHPLGFPVEEASALARELGLPIVSLLSGWSYAREGLCLSSPRADVRQRAVKRLVEYVGLARAFGSLLVVGLMQGLRSDEPDLDVANERIAGGLRQAAHAAEAQETELLLEPVNHLQVGFNHTAAAALAMVDRVDFPAMGYMLDTIHMNIEERSLLETIESHASRIRHFHLCETNGGPFGTGGLDFPRVLAALGAAGYDRYVSVKVYREADWEEGARGAAEFLKRCDVGWP
jgi:sugar phosphate isomerase/epimerase